MKPLAFARPWLGEEEAEAARQTILSGWVTQGPAVQAFEQAFAAATGARHACAVSSCTAALHLALLSVGVRPGDVVLTVSHSFIATANAVRHCLAEPWFVDIDADTLNLSPAALQKTLDEEFRQRDGGWWLRRPERLEACPESPLRLLKGPVGRLGAILAVHQVGLPADMAAILQTARACGVPVVEDAACAAGSLLDADGQGLAPIGRPHGDVACFSLHPRKVLTTGDGGMLTTNDPDKDRLFRLLRQHGMNLTDLERHNAGRVLVESYVTTGFNYRMTDVQAALGQVQMDRLGEIIRRRRESAGRYAALLAGIPGLRTPAEPEHARTNWQSYVVRLAPEIDRAQVMDRLLQAGIPTRRGVMSAHLEPPYAAAWPLGCLPNSEAASRHCLILPMHHEMDESACRRVATALEEAVACPAVRPISS
jgi:dTDP-4-amino-4,6-dideoxygalactose transaminase